MSLGVGWEQELGDEFEGDVDEFDEFGGVVAVCLLHFGMCLMSLGVRLMSLAVGLEQELGDEFGGDFAEFDELGGRFLVRLREKGVRLMSLGVRLLSLGMSLEKSWEMSLEVILMSLMSLGVVSLCVCEEKGCV